MWSLSHPLLNFLSLCSALRSKRIVTYCACRLVFLKNKYISTNADLVHIIIPLRNTFLNKNQAIISLLIRVPQKATHLFIYFIFIITALDCRECCRLLRMYLLALGQIVKTDLLESYCQILNRYGNKKVQPHT